MSGEAGSREGWVGRWWKAVLGILYPRMCGGCGTALGHGGRDGETGLCEGCRDELWRLEAPFCERCGEPFEGEITGTFRCSNCVDRELDFDFSVAPYRGEGLLRRLVHRFKYDGEYHLGRTLGALIVDGLEDPRLGGGEGGEMGGGWVMVPVPLHPRRQREREFNQAAELCRALRGCRPGWRMVNVLRRTRYTERQAKLDRSERLKNLRGAFALRRGWVGWSRWGRLRGARVLLVDDVLTTGATTHECAKVLKEEAGVDKVVVLTVARS